MNDTPPDIAAAFSALLMQRSEGERAKMAFEMFDLARVLMTADIRARHPGITETELRVQIFERTYGSDFDEATALVSPGAFEAGQATSGRSVVTARPAYRTGPRTIAPPRPFPPPLGSPIR